MMNAVEINQALYRPLLDGGRYGLLLPHSDCSSVFLGNGDTKFNIDNMRETAYKYQHHTEKLTPELFRTDLEAFCRQIHWFLFNHLQYKLDGEEQKLRSPACSWKSRTQGIDCKSYSIFASTILLNAGISHYMRRIKQAQAPNGFTHVYIVVPKDQKHFNLKKGYYTIDGTIRKFAELPFIEKDDLFVLASEKNRNFPKKPKTALAGAVQHSSGWDYINGFLTESNLTADQSLQMTEAILKEQNSAIVQASVGVVAAGANIIPVIGQIVSAVLFAITPLVGMAVRAFSNPCSGSYYVKWDINQRLETDFKTEFSRRLQRIETHLKQNSFELAISDLNFLLKEVDLGYAHYMAELGRHTQDCSRETLASYQTFIMAIKQVIDNMLHGISLVVAQEYNFSVLLQKSSTANRSLYFIVPSGKEPIPSEFRKIHIESRDEKRGMYPYGTEQNFDAWLSENVVYLKVREGHDKAEAYRREMLPFKEKIITLRKNIHLPVQVRVSQENKLRKEQYEIYLKYDNEYKDALLKQSKDTQEAWQKANASFVEELKKIYALRLQDEKRRLENVTSIAQDNANKHAGIENKKTLNLLILGVVGTIIIKSLNK